MKGIVYLISFIAVPEISKVTGPSRSCNILGTSVMLAGCIMTFSVFFLTV